jgi:hypothetical protein
MQQRAKTGRGRAVGSKRRGASSNGSGIPKGGPHLSKAALLLRAWRRKKKMTQWQATAFLFGEGYEKTSAFELGYRRPSLALAVQIRERTGIPAESWMEPASASALAEERLLKGRRTSVA